MMKTRSLKPAFLLATVLAACALLAAPALAGATTITYSGGSAGVVIYAAEPGETLDTSVGFQPRCVEPGGIPYDCVTFYGDAVGSMPPQCLVEASGEVSCVLDPDHSGVAVRGGDGNDSVSVFESDLEGFPAAAGYAIAVEGGAGNDRLDGGSGPETIHGGPGADLLAGRGGGDALFGDDGNDTIYGDGMANGNEGLGGGDDQLHGGAGDDVLTGDTHESDAAIGHDLLDGGPGTDTVKDDWYRFDGSANDEDPPPTVTFDGIADDGRPGEGDNVVEVERIESGSPAGAVPATFVGDDGPNAFLLIFTNGVVDGRGGADTIEGSDYADALQGGAGDDHISGGFGDDTITGGPGRDDLSGDRTAACEYGPIYGICTIGSGNDTIYAQDGEADKVDCGPGADTAYVDAVDVVANCESVQVAGGPTAGLGTPPTAGGPAKSGPPAGAPKVSVPHRRLAAVVRARALLVVCRLPAAGRCTVRATIAAGVARALGLKVGRHAKAYRLAAGSARLAKAGHRTIRLPLSRRAARALGRARSLTVRLAVTAVYAKARRTATTRVILTR
jgi:Ca2+-binding RTX toxin-like protein